MTNKAVLETVMNKRQLWKNIKSRKENERMTGRMPKHESLLETRTEGDVGHIGIVRPRTEYGAQIIKDVNKKSYKDLTGLCYKREA